MHNIFFFWFDSKNYIWQDQQFIESEFPPNLKNKTIIVGGDSQKVSSFNKMFSNTRLNIISYQEYFGIEEPISFEDAKLLIQQSQKYLKIDNLFQHRKLSSAIFYKFSKKIWKEYWNFQRKEDKTFLKAEIFPYSEAKILSSEQFPEWEISSIDMNSMFPYIISQYPFMNPKKLKFFRGEPENNHLWMAKCEIKWNEHCSKDDREWFSQNHPFIHSYEYSKINSYTKLPAIDIRGIPFSLEEEFTLSTWIFSEEVKTYSKYISIKPIHGVSSPKISHPFKNTIDFLMQKRIDVTHPLEKLLCKNIANISVSSTFKSPNFWNPWYLKWRSDEKVIRKIKGVFSFSIIMKTYARLFLFQKLEWMKESLPEHRVAYSNIDSIHFLSPNIDKCLDILKEKGNIGIHPGQWKIEWKAKAGVWPAARFYWLKDVTFPDGSFQKILHASFVSDDPFAKGHLVENEGKEHWISNKSAWKSQRNYKLSSLQWFRLPLEMAKKKTHAPWSGTKVGLALHRFLKNNSAKNTI